MQFIWDDEKYCILKEYCTVKDMYTKHTFMLVHGYSKNITDRADLS